MATSSIFPLKGQSLWTGLAAVLLTIPPITRGVEAKQIIKEEKNSDLIQENQKQNLEVVNQIKELKDLHDKGILNDEEFQKAKEKLLM